MKKTQILDNSKKELNRILENEDVEALNIIKLDLNMFLNKEIKPLSFSYQNKKLFVISDAIHRKEHLIYRWSCEKGEGKRKDLNIGTIEGIYFIYNPQGHIIYIGWSSNLQQRIRNHLKGNTHTRHFYNEIYEIRSASIEKFEKIRNQLFKLGYDFDDIEYALIDIIKPKYNNHRPSPKRITRKKQDEDI